MLRKYKTVIFIHGCFWHGHEDYPYFTLPKTNTPFWQTKIERNRQRDLFKRLQLCLLGWHTIILWECQLKPRVCDLTQKGLERTLNHIYLENYALHKVKPCRMEESESPCSKVVEEYLSDYPNPLPETDSL